MLRMALDVTLISIKIRERRMGLAGHCNQHPEQAAYHTRETGRRGGRQATFINTLLGDVCLDTGEMRSLKLDREE